MPKTSITCKLTIDEIKENKININNREIGKFFPEIGKNFKIIYGMTEISGEIKSEEIRKKKKSEINHYIELSQDLNFLAKEKIKITKLTPENFEIQKIK